LSEGFLLLLLLLPLAHHLAVALFGFEMALLLRPLVLRFLLGPSSIRLCGSTVEDIPEGEADRFEYLRRHLTVDLLKRLVERLSNVIDQRNRFDPAELVRQDAQSLPRTRRVG
jgi:hypothetical protein